MDRLDRLAEDSIYLIREAYRRFEGVALLWSVGKDSTVLLELCRRAFFGRLPFPVIHLDTGHKFQEIYEIRDRLASEWELDLVIARNWDSTSPAEDRFSCCHSRKTLALKKMVEERGLRCLLVGIRRDEHGIRAKERYFSPRSSSFYWDYRNQPLELWNQVSSFIDGEAHVRVHPMLHWSERDVWAYVLREQIPFSSLYLCRGGERYRSIGCACCCTPVQSTASTVAAIMQELESTVTAEREGRAQDKESAYIMQKLRALGYM